MSTVVIRPDRAGGQSLRDLMVELGALAAQAPDAGGVRSGDRGAVVSWELAQAYLNRRLGVPPAGGPRPVEASPQPPTSRGGTAAKTSARAADGGAAAPGPTGGGRAAAAPRTTSTTRSSKTGRNAKESR